MKTKITIGIISLTAIAAALVQEYDPRTTDVQERTSRVERIPGGLRVTIDVTEPVQVEGVWKSDVTAIRVARLQKIRGFSNGQLVGQEVTRVLDKRDATLFLTTVRTNAQGLPRDLQITTGNAFWAARAWKQSAPPAE